MADFFTRDDLKNRLYIRQNQHSLLAANIRLDIAGRLYQVATNSTVIIFF